MNNQERSVSFDARLQGRGVAAGDSEQGEPAGSEPTQSLALRQNASGDQKLNGEAGAAPGEGEDEALHGRASPYNLRWTIRH